MAMDLHLGDAPAPAPAAPEEPARSIRLLPATWPRAALLTVLAVLACLQIGAAVVLAEAWRTSRGVAPGRAGDLARLDEVAWRLRTLELSVVVGVVLFAMVWSFVAVVNVRRAGRTDRHASVAASSWLLAPAAAVALAVYEVADRPDHLRWAVMVVPALLLAVPFRLLGGAAVVLGGERTPFQRWYLMSAAAIVVSYVAARPLELRAGADTTEIGRTALFHLTEALLLGLVVMLAADATRSIDTVVHDRVDRFHLNEENAALRFRLHVPATAAWIDT